MDMLKIAIKNVKDSIGLYRLYIVSMIFSVMIYYQFINLSDNPTINLMEMSDIVGALTFMAIFIMMIFVVFFLFFSNTFYIRERKKEIGLYILIGTTPKKIGMIIAIENMIIYAIATIIGVLSGIIFSKLFIMITIKYLNLGMTIDFHISTRAILQSLITFMVLGLLTSLNGYLRIRTKSIVALLKGKSMEEQIPRGNIIIGIISLIILLGGYYCSAIMDTMNLLFTGLGAIILVTIGTSLMYRSVMTSFFKRALSFKKYIYKNNRLLVVSTLMHRIGSNYKVYAAVTIFLACTLTAFATSASFKYGIDDMNKVRNPYSIKFETSTPTGLYDDLITYIQAQHGQLAYSNQNLPYYVIKSAGLSVYRGSSQMDIVAYATYKNSVQSMDYKTEKAVLYNGALDDNQCLYLNPGESIITVANVKYIDVEGVKYNTQKSIKAPLFGNRNDTMIVNDQLYESLKSSIAVDENGQLKQYYFNGIKIVNDEDFLKIHAVALQQIADDYQVTLDYTMTSLAMESETIFIFIQLFYVIGIFLTLTFIVATGSIIYFKIISNASEDIHTFRLLYKLGMGKKAILSVINKQVSIFFAFPLMIAFVHAYFASKALERFMGISLLVPLIYSSLTVTAIFFLYYWITIRRYKQIVLS